MNAGDLTPGLTVSHSQASPPSASAEMCTGPGPRQELSNCERSGVLVGQSCPWRCPGVQGRREEGVCRQSLPEEREPRQFPYINLFSTLPRLSVAWATKCFPSPPELVGTISITVPLSINKRHQLSQDTQPRCRGGEEIRPQWTEGRLLPGAPPRGCSLGEPLWAGRNVSVPGTKCNGPSSEKGELAASSGARQ